MTERNTSDRDVNRAIRSWLHEDRHEDVSRVAGAVLDRVETIPQRRATWWPAWRTPTMNKFVTYRPRRSRRGRPPLRRLAAVRFVQPVWHAAKPDPEADSIERRQPAHGPFPTSCGTPNPESRST